MIKLCLEVHCVDNVHPGIAVTVVAFRLHAAGKVKTEYGKPQKDSDESDERQNFFDCGEFGFHSGLPLLIYFDKNRICTGILSANGVTSYYRFSFVDSFARI